MTNQNKVERPDAFKARMATAQSEFGKPELARQCQGRPLTDEETDFAEALMAIYAEGISDQAFVAAALQTREIPMPSSSKTDWSKETLATELQRLNADLDQAYLENGFGA